MAKTTKRKHRPIMLALNDLQRAYLEQLLATGLYGLSIQDVARQLVDRQLREMLTQNLLERVSDV